jgi:hypothetical protein
MGFAMRTAARGLAVALAVACTLVEPGTAVAGDQPIVSAPSQYIEVVPTAGGSVPGGSRPQLSSSDDASGPGSALGAAADAAASADRLGMLVLGAAMVAATGFLAAAAVRRRGGSRPA